MIITISFSRGVKAELCGINTDKPCCAFSELYGILLYCNSFGVSGIKIITENADFAGRTAMLLKQLFNMEFDKISKPGSGTGKIIMTIIEPGKLKKIFESFGHSPEREVAVHLNLGVFEDECCPRAFLRGAFLSGGSVMEPEKKYHLELVTSHPSLCRETCAILVDLGLAPKQVMRKSYHVIYFKASEAIEDFLSMTGAQLSAIRIMEAMVEKDFRNSINRKVNCETANLTKTVDASRKQCAAVERLKETAGFDSLPENLRRTAELRLDNPEASLVELAEMLEPPVSKSAINHRMRKLMQMAREYDTP